MRRTGRGHLGEKRRRTPSFDDLEEDEPTPQAKVPKLGPTPFLKRPFTGSDSITTSSHEY